jgi:lactoylglutathione lyase
MKITLFTIHVQDMASSLAFYKEFLNMKIIREMSPRDDLRLVFLKGEGEVEVELIEDKAITTLDAVKSNVSIGIYVDNLEAIVALIKEKKIRVKRGPISIPSGEKLLFINDPNGIEIEFIEGKQN